MKLSVNASRSWLVAACFGGFIAFCVAAQYLVAFIPSAEEGCIAQCKINDMEGHMVHIHPASMTGGMRGKEAKECKCLRPGSSP